MVGLAAVELEPRVLRLPSGPAPARAADPRRRARRAPRLPLSSARTPGLRRRVALRHGRRLERGRLVGDRVDRRRPLLPPRRHHPGPRAAPAIWILVAPRLRLPRGRQPALLLAQRRLQVDAPRRRWARLRLGGGLDGALELGGARDGWADSLGRPFRDRVDEGRLLLPPDRRGRGEPRRAARLGAVARLRGARVPARGARPRRRPAAGSAAHRIAASTICIVEQSLRIGVLAVQGNFREHAAVLPRLGAEPVELRLPAQLDGLDGLILPGGESTAIMRLMRLYGLDEAVRRFDGPIFGTCAGMIVLDRDHLGLVDVRVQRNAFGRQVKSFEADVDIGHGDEPVRAVFIRAPWIETSGPDVEVLAEVDGHPVLARQGRILVAAFHPELTDDTRIHELFLDQVREETSVRA